MFLRLGMYRNVCKGFHSSLFHLIVVHFLYEPNEHHSPGIAVIGEEENDQKRKLEKKEYRCGKRGIEE